MNKILLALVVMVGLTASVYASSPNDTRANMKAMSAKKIKKMDNRLTKHKAVKRNFKSKKEFSQRRQKNHTVLLDNVDTDILKKDGY